MGEYADDYIDRWIGDSDWGFRRPRYPRFRPRPPKPTNEEIFKEFVVPFQLEISSGMSGYYVVVVDNTGNFPEAYSTGIGRYPTIEGAIQEAEDWSEGEGIPFIRPTHSFQSPPPVDMPIDFSKF